MPRLLIIDDHQIYLDGLELILVRQMAGAQVFKAGNAPHAIEVIQQQPDMDLILLDLNWQEQSGLEIWSQLTAQFGPLPLAVLSASDRPADILACQRKGALGYINKSVDNEQLIQAITSLLSGEPYFPYPLPLASDLKLTPRQNDVLALLAEGLPNKAICQQLNMSEATVKTHLRTLYSLLDVNTRTQCVTVAKKYALID